MTIKVDRHKQRCTYVQYPIDPEITPESDRLKAEAFDRMVVEFLKTGRNYVRVGLSEFIGADVDGVFVRDLGVSITPIDFDDISVDDEHEGETTPDYE